MSNELILWQMRKCAYNNGKSKDSIQFADKMFHFIEWLQDKYLQGVLVGNFHSHNIVKEIWNKFSKEPGPLQSMHSFSNVYDSFGMYFTGDNNNNE